MNQITIDARDLQTGDSFDYSYDSGVVTVTSVVSTKVVVGLNYMLDDVEVYGHLEPAERIIVSR